MHFLEAFVCFSRLRDCLSSCWTFCKGGGSSVGFYALFLDLVKGVWSNLCLMVVQERTLRI